jgi:hypothetical protein
MTIINSFRRDLLKFKAKLILDDKHAFLEDQSYHAELNQWFIQLSWFRKRVLGWTMQRDVRPWPEKMVLVRCDGYLY